MASPRVDRQPAESETDPQKLKEEEKSTTAAAAAPVEGRKSAPGDDLERLGPRRSGGSPLHVSTKTLGADMEGTSADEDGSTREEAHRPGAPLSRAPEIEETSPLASPGEARGTPADGDSGVGVAVQEAKTDSDIGVAHSPSAVPSAAAQEQGRAGTHSSEGTEEFLIGGSLGDLCVRLFHFALRLGESEANPVVSQVLYLYNCLVALRSLGMPERGATFARIRATAELLEAREGPDSSLGCDLSVLLVGRPGVVKTATIHNLLGLSYGTEDAKPTEEVTEMVGTVRGVTFRLLEVPGLHGGAASASRNLKVLRGARKFLGRRQTDVVLLLDRLDGRSQSYEDMEIAQSIQQVFGQKVWSGMVSLLTHAGGPLPEDSEGVAMDYQLYTKKRMIQVQEILGVAAMDANVAFPVLLGENHPACQVERERREKVLPNGQAWRPHVLLSCLALRTLEEMKGRTLLRDGGEPPARPRAPTIRLLLENFMEKSPLLRLPEEAAGGTMKAAEKEQGAAEEGRRDRGDHETGKGKEGPVEIPLPDDMPEVPLSFGSDYPVHRYRETVSESGQGLMHIRPISHPLNGWDQDVGCDSFQVEAWGALLNSRHLPAALSAEIKKEKRGSRIKMLAGTTARHGVPYHGCTPTSTWSFDMDFPGEEEFQAAVQTDVRLGVGRSNTLGLGCSLTECGGMPQPAIGLKVEDSLALGKGAFLEGIAGLLSDGERDRAWGMSIGAVILGEDHPVSPSLHRIGLSLFDYQNSREMELWVASERQVTPQIVLELRGNVSSWGRGKVVMKCPSSECLLPALVGLWPVVKRLVGGCKR